MYSYISHRHIKTRDRNKIYMWNLYAFARLRVRNVSDSKLAKRLSVQWASRIWQRGHFFYCRICAIDIKKLRPTTEMHKNGDIYMIISPASNKEQNPPKILTTVTDVFGKFYTVVFQTAETCNVHLTTSATVVLWLLCCALTHCVWDSPLSL